MRFFEDALEILFEILWRVLGVSWEILGRLFGHFWRLFGDSWEILSEIFQRFFYGAGRRWREGLGRGWRGAGEGGGVLLLFIYFSVSFWKNWKRDENEMLPFVDPVAVDSAVHQLIGRPLQRQRFGSLVQGQIARNGLRQIALMSNQSNQFIGSSITHHHPPTPTPYTPRHPIGPHPATVNSWRSISQPLTFFLIYYHFSNAAVFHYIDLNFIFYIFYIYIFFFFDPVNVIVWIVRLWCGIERHLPAASLNRRRRDAGAPITRQRIHENSICVSLSHR